MREGVFASQFDAQAKEKEGIEGKMAEMAESHILEMKAKADEEEQRMRELKEEEKLRLEKLQKEKEDEINRFVDTLVYKECQFILGHNFLKRLFKMIKVMLTTLLGFQKNVIRWKKNGLQSEILSTRSFRLK